MWMTFSTLVVTMVLLEMQGTVSAAPSQDWQERLLEKEYNAELYNMLQNCLSEVNRIQPRAIATKRNSEIINSLLALPKSMAEVGR